MMVQWPYFKKATPTREVSKFGSDTVVVYVDIVKVVY